MLRIITCNCYNIKSSIQDISDLCNSYDLIFLQEIWLFQHELSLLSNISSEFEGFGTTAMDTSNGIILGRPYGGVAVLIRKSIRNKCQIHTFDDSRLLGVTINSFVSSMYSSPRDQLVYNWAKTDITDVNNYCMQTYRNFSKISIPSAIKCTKVNCKSIEHRHETDFYYSEICKALHCSSLDFIPSSKSSDCRDYIVPGFNDYVKDLHSTARSDYGAWRDAGKPRSGAPCSNMRRSRLKFKYALRQCKRNEDAICSDQYAKSLLDKDMVSFWKHIQKSNNIRVPLASTVGGVTGESEIAEMWQDHYKSILNSVKNNTRQQFVTNKLDSIRGESIMFSTADINVALHSLKSEKSCGVDGLAAEHFMFAHRITHVFLSLLFNTFILHGFLPADFMKTAMVPIIKNKTGDTSDKNNYRPIALVTAASKVFEICILEILETYLLTHDYQFGFKAKHSTDMCIFTVKTLIKYYTDQNTPVYTCLLDASKAFDRVNHWTLLQSYLNLMPRY